MSMPIGVTVNDTSPITTSASARLGGGVSFGSMGSGTHTSGGALPSWAIPAAIAAGLLLLFMLKKKGK